MQQKVCVAFPSLKKEWQEGFEAQGFKVKCYASLCEAKEDILKNPAVLLCDELFSNELGKQIRKIYQGIVIASLMEGASEIDEILALEFGADDVVKRSVGFRLLWVRFDKLQNRLLEVRENDLEYEKSIIRIKDLEINALQSIVKISAQEVSLTGVEYKILECFAKHYGQTLSREQIINYAQGFDFEGFDRTIDSHVKNIRRKISLVKPGESYIKTVYGLGYKMVIV